MAKPWIVKPLVLPYGEKEYQVDPLDYASGLTLIDVLTGSSKKVTSKSEDRVLFRLVMGETWDLMEADHLPFQAMFRAGMASVQYQTALVNGLDCDAAVEIAERMWESGMDPEVLAALVEAADLSNSKDSKPSTSSVSGNAARTARSRTTTSRKATPRTGSKAQPVKRSPSRRSPTPQSGR